MHSAIVGVKTESESKLLSVIGSGVFYHVTVKKVMGFTQHLYLVPHTQGAQAWIRQFHLQITPCLTLPRKRSPDGASTY